VVVFIFSLFFYWLWLPVLTAIYTGIGAAGADAQGFAWFSDIIICLGIGMYRTKKRQSKRVKTLVWVEHPGTINPQNFDTADIEYPYRWELDSSHLPSCKL
jgi:hypothetical protein